MRFFLSILLIVFLIGCSRGYYERLDTYYNYPQAYEYCQNLKTSTLIVQIPCEGKKQRLLKSNYLSEANKKKKSRLKEAYTTSMTELAQAQKSLVKSFSEYYNFSKFVFLPDTLVEEFKQGRRENIFLDKNFEFYSDKSINTVDSYMFLRDYVDYDHLYIYTDENKLPPKPFPYSSTVTTKTININKKATKPENIESERIFIAVATINRKLRDFFHARPPLPSNTQ